MTFSNSIPAENGGTGSGYVSFAGATAPRVYTMPDADTTIADTTQVGNCLQLAGGSLSGALTLFADATSGLQPVTLNQLNAAVLGAYKLQGGYDPTITSMYPIATDTTNPISVNVLQGMIWFVTTAGTVNGYAVAMGDQLIALIDSPGQLAINWGVIANEVGYVPLSNVLNSGDIFVGNASNIATDVTMSGDVSITNAGVTTVTKTNGVSFATSATTDTTNASNISSGTLASGRLSGTYGINVSGNAATVTTNATLTGDVTSVGNATTIATVNSNIGTFGDGTHVSQVTVNAKGQVTAASSVLITGAPPTGSASGDLSSSYPSPTVLKINGSTLGSTTATSGNLLVASGTAWISNAISGDATLASSGALTVSSTGGVSFAPSATTDTTNAGNISSGTLASGRLTGTYAISVSGNAATVTTNANLTGDITSVGNTTTLPTVNSNVGTFGDGTHTSQVTINAKGQVTAASNVLITGASPTGSASGDLSGTYPSPTVAKINNVTLGSTTATAGNLLIGSGTSWVTNAISGDATLASSGALTVSSTGGVTFATSATTDTTNASNISSGTLASGRLTGTYAISISGNASTSTSSSTSTTATNATNVATTSTTTNATFYPLFVASSGNSNQAVDLNTSLSYNPSSGTLTTLTFSGSLSGNASSSTNATNAANCETIQTSSNASFYPLFAASSTNSNQAFNLGTGITFNPNTNNLSTTTFTGALSGNATTSTTATNATNVATTSTTTNATFYLLFAASSTNSNQAPDLNTGLTYNPSTTTLTTTTFSGALSGNATTATSSATATLVDDNTANAAKNLVWSSNTGGNYTLKTSSTELTFNPSTATLTTTTFSGALIGNATTATTATNSTKVATTSTSTNATFYPLFVASSSNSNQAPDLNTSLSYNPSTGELSATIGSFSNVGVNLTSPSIPFDARISTTAGLGTQIGAFGSASGGQRIQFFDEFVSNTAGAKLMFIGGNPAQIAGGGNLNFYTNNNSGVVFSIGAIAGGTGVIQLINASVNPSSTPSAGGVLYCSGGALKYIGTSGTVTNIANA